MYGEYYQGLGEPMSTTEQPPPPDYFQQPPAIAQTQFGFGSIVATLVRAAGGYFAGRALAPSPSKRNEYGAIGAALGATTGVIGLGVMAAVTAGSR